jgi:hypothetical protein
MSDFQVSISHAHVGGHQNFLLGIISSTLLVSSAGTTLSPCNRGNTEILGLPQLPPSEFSCL